MEEIILTQEGYDALVEEYNLATTVKRKEIAEALKEARSYGDLSENAEYDAAKDAQAELEERISKLEEMMKVAKVVDANTDKNKVDVGAKITVEFVNKDGKKEKKEFSIVGSAESNPFAGKLSNESPVGRGLMGHKKGDTVEIQLKEKTATYKIIDIQR
ncbi:MAG: transcription elongation factor GreA [Clostridia bacterium]|nr:transcription elongation factor GreA [Clostridia bacterium]